MMDVFSRAFFLLQIKIENNRFSYHPRNTYFVQLSPSSAIFTFCKTKIIGLSANLKFFFSHKLRQESNYLQRFSRNKYFDHNGKKHSFGKKKSRTFANSNKKITTDIQQLSSTQSKPK